MDYRRHQSQRYGELFEIGALAEALNRTAATVRRWERDRVIPPAPLRRRRDDVRGQRRLYPKRHIEVSRRIAESEGVRDGSGPLPKSFSERMWGAFRLLQVHLAQPDRSEP